MALMVNSGKEMTKYIHNTFLELCREWQKGQRWRETVRDGRPARDMKRRSTACCVLRFHGEIILMTSPAACGFSLWAPVGTASISHTHTDACICVLVRTLCHSWKPGTHICSQQDFSEKWLVLYHNNAFFTPTGSAVPLFGVLLRLMMKLGNYQLTCCVA